MELMGWSFTEMEMMVSTAISSSSSWNSPFENWVMRFNTDSFIRMSPMKELKSEFIKVIFKKTLSAVDKGEVFNCDSCGWASEAVRGR